ncbi:MAG: conjugal transfer protein TraF [Verrucomicrobia bacterium]|nr:conjugal transfer protein TraF [Verrucomicrobiota bacterium]
MANKFMYFVILSLLPSLVVAKEICEKQNLGWHFYCDPTKTKEKALTQEQEVQLAKEELSAIKQRLEDLKIAAVINPTTENLTNYMAFQNEQMNRAGAFSKKWQEIVWQTPSLDSLVKNPISTVGNEVNSEIKRKGIQKTLAHLNERYGLFFFYSSKCVYCLKFSSIIKTFAAHHNLEVMAVSMDGGILPEWPTSVVNSGQAEKLGMAGKPVPAVILFDAKAKRIIPVGFGLLTIDQLEERIFRLTQENSGERNE